MKQVAELQQKPQASHPLALTLALTLVLVGMFALSACSNTIEGVGDDVENMGDEIEEATD